ncbi:nuclear transport factor 2 family protein [Gaetbulibacter sp. M240]|uniref:nuclear transport factor 2 family protein n=1 Tax=Gaetbulibacter sp. M240 TaxID=3126511 RepID=UPI00374E3937
MKVNFREIFILFLFTVQTIDLVAQQETSKVNEYEKYVIDLTNDLTKSWEELNADKYLSYFSTNLDFYIDGNHIDFKVLEGIVRDLMPKLSDSTFEIMEPKVHYASSNIGIISFKIKETFLLKNDNYDELKGVMTLIWEKKLEQWKITMVHESLSKTIAEN